MNKSTAPAWENFQKRFFQYPGFSLDLSRVGYPDDLLVSMKSQFQAAFTSMEALERGAIANRDENRMVGHYWLRNPALAPNPTIRQEIESTIAEVVAFARRVHSGEIAGSRGPFKNILLIGIGGSALGPQFVSNALSHPTTDRMDIHFFDNTDPDGMDRVLSRIILELGQTLCVVVSKSGGTKETRNGMLEAAAAFRNAGLDFPRHAVAVTGVDSELDRLAAKEGWIARFPMWDWVGGRTSELSAVGLLPAALQGFDIDEMLAGAAESDALTRIPQLDENPAALLAMAWHYLGDGHGRKDMVIIPYKDRLELLSRYMQQLVMESLGKSLDSDGEEVNQGLAVYGNKGSTDQHAYIQQLREGLDNFFVLFVEVLKERSHEPLFVEPGVTSGDYLTGFLLGTQQALLERGRKSITLTVSEVTARSVGFLIALFERSVGFYASLIGINAYHQPGVEAGKKAATKVLKIQRRIQEELERNRGRWYQIETLAESIGEPASAETIFKICEHLTSSPGRRIEKQPGKNLTEVAYRSN